MTDEKIIEYVMDSPENTNPSVLDSMLKSNKVQPDWNQNDLTASDYIKNKPFYEEVTNVAMLPETKFNFGIELTNITLVDSFPYTFNIGQEYTVTLDGETKVTHAVDDNGTVSIFTASLEEFYSGTGYKLLVFQGKLQLATKAFDLAEHTISLSGEYSNVYKINEKYLPDEIIIDGSPFFYNRLTESQLMEIVKAFSNGRNITMCTVYGWTKLISCSYSKDFGFKFVFFSDIDEICQVTGTPGSLTSKSYRIPFK